jgi:hypothetical protein
MAFGVYPDPPDAPLHVPASGSGPLVPIVARVSDGGASPTMFVSVVRVAGSPAAPPPGIRLQADSGPPMLVPASPFGDNVNNGTTDVAICEYEPLPGVVDGYLVSVVLIVHDGGTITTCQWKVGIDNTDPSHEHRFVWVVADSATDSAQPWIDVAPTVTIDAVAGRPAAHGALTIANFGSGGLQLTGIHGGELGAGFTIASVPDVIPGNSSVTADVAFAPPAVAGINRSVYTFDCDDTTARLTPGHNSRTTLTASTRVPHWSPGDVLVVDTQATDGRTDGNRGALIRVDPATGEQAVVCVGSDFRTPSGVAVERSGHVLVADSGAFDGSGAVFRVDADSGVPAVLARHGGFSDPGVVLTSSDGGILVVDSTGFGGTGAVVRIDPGDGHQTVVAQGGMFRRPIGAAFDPTGTSLVVLDADAFDGTSGVIRVTLAGAQTAVSSGHLLREPTGIAVDATGRILVTDPGADGGPAIVAIAANGTQTILSSGQLLVTPTRVHVGPTGAILVADLGSGGGTGGVVGVGPTDGHQSALSFGALFRAPFGITVIPGQTG